MNLPAFIDHLPSLYQDPMFWLFPMGTLAVSTGTFLLFAIPYTLVAVVLVLIWPLLRLSPIHQGEMPAWYVVIAQLGFFILLDDFLYYWMHRTMHKGWLLKHVHSIHHRIRHTTAINGNYMHPIEYLCTAGLALIGPMLVGAHLHVLWIWLALRQY